VDKRYDVCLRAEPEFCDATTESEQNPAEYAAGRSAFTDRWQCHLGADPIMHGPSADEQAGGHR
jgi:hypothetical protein